MRGWEVLYLTGEELSINAHQQTQPKKRPSHNQYPNPANLLPPPFAHHSRPCRSPRPPTLWPITVPYCWQEDLAAEGRTRHRGENATAKGLSCVPCIHSPRRIPALRLTGRLSWVCLIAASMPSASLSWPGPRSAAPARGWKRCREIKSRERANRHSIVHCAAETAM